MPRYLGMPASASTRVASSIIEIRLVQAANTSARKKSAMKKRPAGIRANSCGTQMNVSPSLPAPTISFATSGRRAKAVHSTMMPASSDMELLPKPRVKALSVVSSLRRM